MKSLGEMIIKPFQKFGSDNASQMAAAIAYYTIFSISPLIIIALAIAGQFYNQGAARAQLMSQISGVVGQNTATFLGTILDNTQRSSSGVIASIISIVVLLLGASGIFSALQFALNRIWGVPANVKRGIVGNLLNRLRAFLMVLVVGFLLLVFLVASAVLSSFISRLPGTGQNAVWPQVLNLLVLFLIMTVLFALVFRVVPDKEIAWSDVWLGAAITSILFIIGRYAISLYLTFSKSGSTYGAAGSLVVLLLWIYYSAQIFLLGGEFTAVFASKFGTQRKAAPNSNAAPEMQAPNQQQVTHNPPVI